jgi:5-methylcytosine-specific restriction endonuclease McrA
VPYYQTERGRSAALAKSRRRRMLLEAAPWDGVTDNAILRRDGWLCGVPECRQPARAINPGVRYPDPASPSVDHIVPLSLGGDDTQRNKRAAHLGCNVARGNRPDEAVLASDLG